MATYPPPTHTLSIFNPANFTASGSYLPNSGILALEQAPTQFTEDVYIAQQEIFNNATATNR